MQTGLMEYFRKSLLGKALLVFAALSFIAELWFPTVALALTSGPSQPEIQSFEPVGTTDMVDLFTGDFVYNIPLFELPGPNGGYPFNLAYHSGIGMDQEASWVGLGWNLNPGAIDRTMRGIPDDFNGDQVKKTLDIKPNHTFGLGVGADIEVFGGSPGKSFSTDLKVYYNNYKGVGYSLNPSFGLQLGGTHSAGLGVGLTLDSQEGAGLNASVSASRKVTKDQTQYSLGIGFHSRRGLDMSLSASRSEKTGTSYRGGRKTPDNAKDYNSGGGGGSTYSFSESTYTPLTSMAMQNDFLSVAFKTGVGTGGVFTDMNFSGFYSVQYFKDAKEAVPYKSFGYSYLGSPGRNNKSLLDFNRSNDGIIRKTSPNLPIPSLTYDYYNILGQGIGGMFRPYRNDIGSVYDPEVYSNTTGGSLGFDIGPGASPHVGVEGSFTSGESYTGPWTDDNPWYTKYSFRDNLSSPSGSPEYEAVYFKSRGEYTSFGLNEMDYIGGEAPFKASFTKEGFLPAVYKPDIPINIGDKRPDDGRGRMPRTMVPQPVTNEQLGGNTEVLGEFGIKYYTEGTTNYKGSALSGQVERVNRGTASSPKDVSDHYGGFTVLNPEGARYVYGLPVYNNVNEERIFSTNKVQDAVSCGPTIPFDFDGSEVNYNYDQTDEFFSKTELPPYAYSYLLTSILGNDYVDADGIPGPSAGDYGYWVKFNYVKADADYKWRAPYRDANYIKGLATSAADNKASFVYGEKEVFYLATAETKTHIAVFEISPRQDGFGVADRFNLSADGIQDIGANSKSYRLDKIKLFTKEEYNLTEPVPLKTVDFVYDYSLCSGVYNNQNNGGKLTLTQLKITYQKSARGSLIPYIFTYADTDTETDDNPSYNEHSYDRWGNYKPLPSGADNCKNLEDPYVKQFDKDKDQSKNEKTAFKAETDNNASVWHLKAITLPSGGTIAVNYESDDYAYVQHRQALQMFKVSSGCVPATEPWELYSESYTNQDFERRVYFDLEYPIPTETANTAQKILNDYIKPLRRQNGEYQLYYNIKVKLRDNYWENVSGYADLQTTGLYPYDVDQTCISAIDIGGGPQPCYKRGYVTLKKTQIKGNDIKHHPFSIAAWQHMRVNQPDLLTTSVSSAPPGSSKAEKAEKVKSLASIFPAMKQLFSNYMDHAESKGWGKYVNREQSFIRLGTPDKIKYGGGVRVKQISFNDNWNNSTADSESHSSYGQVYDYTMPEDGMVISSGVAQYEPMTGGDENALRYAKTYPEGIRLKTDNNLFFEYPINEAYFPGPQVGYSKVTVKSIATGNVMASAPLSYELTTTSGVAVHEFYTAREFPVITDETEIDKQPYDLFIPIPLIGMIKTNNLTASQGYSIELNDMHGKPKSVSNYALDADGRLVETPVSSVRYEYKFRHENYDGTPVKVLDNKVNVIRGDQFPAEEKMAGVEYEFFTDMRKSRSTSSTEGLNGNVDQIGPFPIPVPWPTVTKFTNDLRTVVTNKIIHRAGILEKTIATDGLSTVAANNVLFDAVTGRPLLTTVTNNYDAPIYNYEIPAHWEYNGMGAAYRNIGLKFNSSFTLVSAAANHYSAGNSAILNQLVPGDEFIATDNSLKIKVTYLGNNLFHFPSVPNQGSIEMLLVRSGARNMLNTSIGAISALQDPTVNKQVKNYDTYTIPRIPDELVEFLNSIITCDGQLEMKNYIFSGEEFIDNEGNFKFNQLRQLFSSIQITPCGITACSNVPYKPNCFGNSGYHIEFYTTSNVFRQCHCLAQRILDDNTPSIIKEFVKLDDNTIEVHYLNPGLEKTMFSPVCADFTDCWEPFNIQPKVTYIKDVINASASEFRNFWDFNNEEYSCNNPAPLEQNLYASGKKGIWRAYKNYYYKDDRYQSPTGINLSLDGIFEGDILGEQRFYQFKWNSTLERPIPNEWVSSQTITHYNQNNFETENRDILGIYSSAIYGHSKALPVAVGTNTRDNEFYFEGFDDPSSVYNVTQSSFSLNADINWNSFDWSAPIQSGGNTYYYVTVSTPDLTAALNTGDFIYLNGSNYNGWFEITSITSTGITFIAQNNGEEIVPAEALQPVNFTPGNLAAHTGKKSALFQNSNQTLFSLDAVFDLTGVKLVPGKKYILSCWTSVYEPLAGTLVPMTVPDFNPEGVKARVQFYNSNGNPMGTYTGNAGPKGEVIEGWQKIEYEFTPPEGTAGAAVLFTMSGSKKFLFDDLRIFPAKGNMQSYVYDPASLRVSAILDQNNFAAFYSYDEEGNLFLVQKETPEGIMTLKEVRGHKKEN